MIVNISQFLSDEGGFVAKMVTGCLRRIEKINICINLTKIRCLVTDENMGLCLYIIISFTFAQVGVSDFEIQS